MGDSYRDYQTKFHDEKQEGEKKTEEEKRNGKEENESIVARAGNYLGFIMDIIVVKNEPIVNEFNLDGNAVVFKFCPSAQFFLRAQNSSFKIKNLILTAQVHY